MVIKELIRLSFILKILRRDFPGIKFKLRRQDKYFYFISLDSLSLMSTVQFNKRARVIKRLYARNLRKYIIFVYFNDGTAGFN